MIFIVEQYQKSLNNRIIIVINFKLIQMKLNVKFVKKVFILIQMVCALKELKQLKIVLYIHQIKIIVLNVKMNLFYPKKV